jgi:hypothetical protein
MVSKKNRGFSLVQLATIISIYRPFKAFSYKISCGERGIRTPGTREDTADFESAAFDHSAISP